MASIHTRTKSFFFKHISSEIVIYSASFARSCPSGVIPFWSVGVGGKRERSWKEGIICVVNTTEAFGGVGGGGILLTGVRISSRMFLIIGSPKRDSIGDALQNWIWCILIATSFRGYFYCCSILYNPNRFIVTRYYPYPFIAVMYLLIQTRLLFLFTF